ncbi:1836_t:CDS:2, partial [Scutellospora calospora]
PSQDLMLTLSPEPADIESATDYLFLPGPLQDSMLKLPLELAEINSLPNFSPPLTNFSNDCQSSIDTGQSFLEENVNSEFVTEIYSEDSEDED